MAENKKHKIKEYRFSKKTSLFAFIFLLAIVFNIGIDFSFEKSSSLGITITKADASGGTESLPTSNPSSSSGSSLWDKVKTKAEAAVNIITDPVGSGLLLVYNTLLFAVFVVFSTLLMMAGAIFDWAVNPNNFTLVVGSGAIFKGWQAVQSVLNVFFILVLLFSSMATIFQVDKYHLIKGKILLNVLLMALLTNFSFPIARFIIDFANVIMYFFLAKIFPDLSNGSGVSALVVSMGKIGAFIAPTENSFDTFTSSQTTVQLLFAAIFVFVFCVTILMIAILLVIRISVLAIIIVFAPVGFVASILPSVSKYADEWWEGLFKQSFSGPIMIFMMWLAFKLMESIQDQMKRGFQNVASIMGVSGKTSTIIVNGAFNIIPIIILWTGIIAAQKLGAAGAAAVDGMRKNTQKKALNWGKKKSIAGLKAGARAVLTKKDSSGNVTSRVQLPGRAGNVLNSAARASHAKAEAEKAEKYKSYNAALNSMSQHDLMEEAKSQTGHKKYLAAQVAVKKGVHKNASRADVKALHETFTRHNDVDNAKKIVEDRPDYDLNTVSNTDYANRERRRMVNGDHKKDTAVHTWDEARVNKLIDSIGIDETMKMVSEMPAMTQKHIEEILNDQIRALHTNGVSTTTGRGLELRRAAAAASFDPHKYFSDLDASGNVQNTISVDPSLRSEAEKYFNKRTGKQLAAYSDEALEEIGEVISTIAPFKAAADNMNASQQVKFKAGAMRNANAAVRHHSTHDPHWRSI